MGRSGPRHWGNEASSNDDSKWYDKHYKDVECHYDDEYEEEPNEENDEASAATDYLSSRPWGYDNNGV